jgi:hypothetical protein
VYRCLLVAVGVLAAAACTVEPTPREMIDRQIPAAETHAQLEAALRDQILRLMEALQSGDAEAAHGALTPAAGVTIIGPGEEQRLTGAAQANALVELASATRVGTLTLRDLQVNVTRRCTVGWFVAILDFQRTDTAAAAVPLRVTGLYVEREAVWELQQAHLSVPSDLLNAPPPYPQAPSPPEGAG